MGQLCVLHESEPLLAQLPMSDVWGIGRRLTQRLEAQGITTALHLQQADLAMIRHLLGIVGVRTVLELRGVDRSLAYPQIQNCGAHSPDGPGAAGHPALWGASAPDP